MAFGKTMNDASRDNSPSSATLAATLQEASAPTAETTADVAKSNAVDWLPHLLDQRRAECYQRLNKTATTNYVTDKHCPGTFDGWLCWPTTKAATSAYARCPDFVTGFDPTRYAHKECGSDGEWFKHPLTNKPWSNYTTCVNMDDLEWKHNINLIYEIGYCISLVAILLSLAILGYFKSLMEDYILTE